MCIRDSPTIVIPSYVKKEKRECIDSFLTITYSLLFIIIVLILLFRYQMIGIFTNRDEMFVNIACNVLIVLLLSQYVMSITDITVAYFQCNGNYNVPKIINLFSQLIVIILLILIKNFSIYGYAIIISDVYKRQIIDSLAAGLPIISSEWENVYDIIDEKVGFIYKFNCLDDLYNILLSICENPETVINKKRNCLLKAKNFTSDSAIMILLTNIFYKE